MKKTIGQIIKETWNWEKELLLDGTYTLEMYLQSITALDRLTCKVYAETEDAEVFLVLKAMWEEYDRLTSK